MAEAPAEAFRVQDVCAYILVAEDDTMQAELIRRLLVKDGHTVRVVEDGQRAIDEAARRLPDVLVLDLMLPEIDGLGVCRAVRRIGNVRVLMLTARAAENDVLLGLDLGADDYMTKPYSPRELLARIRAVLRRAGQRPESTPILRVGDITVDSESHLITCAGASVSCTPGEFAILQALASTPNRVFSRRELLQRTRGYDRASTERVVDVHIANLRKKIEVDPRRPVRIVTVFGFGYKLSSSVHG